jgi:hypothetical protein
MGARSRATSVGEFVASPPASHKPLYRPTDSRNCIAALTPEAHRVLRKGGLFVAVAPSRRDSPELQGLLPPSPPDTFDAEVGPALIAEVFGDVEVDAWDGPYLRLPDSSALRRYLIGRGIEPSLAATCAEQRSFPLTITKRGALLFGRKA